MFRGFFRGRKNHLLGVAVLYHALYAPVIQVVADYNSEVIESLGGQHELFTIYIPKSAGRNQVYIPTVLVAFDS